MKYMVVLLAVLAGVWLIKRNMGRRDEQRRSNRAHGGQSPVKQLVLACSHCGVHVPLDEVVQGRQGVYCSRAHQLTHEGSADVA